MAGKSCVFQCFEGLRAPRIPVQIGGAGQACRASRACGCLGLQCRYPAAAPRRRSNRQAGVGVLMSWRGRSRDACNLLCCHRRRAGSRQRAKSPPASQQGSKGSANWRAPVRRRFQRLGGMGARLHGAGVCAREDLRAQRPGLPEEPDCRLPRRLGHRGEWRLSASGSAKSLQCALAGAGGDLAGAHADLPAFGGANGLAPECWVPCWACCAVPAARSAAQQRGVRAAAASMLWGRRASCESWLTGQRSRTTATHVVGGQARAGGRVARRCDTTGGRWPRAGAPADASSRYYFALSELPRREGPWMLYYVPMTVTSSLDCVLPRW
jgi:hypothetical protein